MVKTTTGELPIYVPLATQGNGWRHAERTVESAGARGSATRRQTGRGRGWERRWGVETATPQGNLPPRAGETPQALSTIIQEG